MKITHFSNDIYWLDSVQYSEKLNNEKNILFKFEDIHKNLSSR